ncbi:5577_t:CDS:1, partial [Gigaspora rosea]
IRDLLYQYLPICPSFVNPPDGDYSQEFFIGKLLPTLRKEAERLFLAEVVAPPYILDIEGALLVGGLKDKSVFECNVCHQYGPTNLKKIKSHLISCHDFDSSHKSLVLGTK